MCGRFCVDDETAKDIERIVRKIDRELWKSGDVHPSDHAFVLRQSPKGILAEQQKWGYSSSFGNTLVFNSRSESVQEKPMFRFDFKTRRCVVPAKKFYEWQKLPPKGKRKYEFFADSGSLYLAGIYREEEDEDHFSILTRAADGCMVGIHDRMPLVLPEEDIGPWLSSDEAAVQLLKYRFEHLKRAESFEKYEQLSLF